MLIFFFKNKHRKKTLETNDLGYVEGLYIVGGACRTDPSIGKPST